MKSVFLMAVSLAVVVAQAALTPEQIAKRKAKRAAMIAAKGGLVTKPLSGRVVRVVNMQDVVGDAELRDVFKLVNLQLGYAWDMKTIAPGKCLFDIVAQEKSDGKTGLVLVVIDDPKKPFVLAAPEDAWGVLNISRLEAKAATPEVRKSRLMKSLSRTYAYAFGVGQSLNKPCVLDPAYSLSDLDALSMSELGPEPQMKISEVAEKRGLEVVHTVTYRQACLEGWAPAPTNEIQKAIFDEVKNPKARFGKDLPELKK